MFSNLMSKMTTHNILFQESQCSGFDSGSICYHCCTTDKCNDPCPNGEAACDSDQGHTSDTDQGKLQ